MSEVFIVAVACRTSRRRKGRHGVRTICAGSGIANATMIEPL